MHLDMGGKLLCRDYIVLKPLPAAIKKVLNARDLGGGVFCIYANKPLIGIAPMEILCGDRFQAGILINLNS